MSIFLSDSMLDSFIIWIQKKIHIQQHHARPSFREKDIFWCSFGENIGDEEKGKWEDFTRPVLIIRKFNKNIFIWIPLSTKIKKDNPYYVSLIFQWRNISAIISQIRTLDSKRLHKKIWTLDSDDFHKVLSGIQNDVFKNFTPFIAEGGVATNVDL